MLKNALCDKIIQGQGAAPLAGFGSSAPSGGLASQLVGGGSRAMPPKTNDLLHFHEKVTFKILNSL